MPKQKRAPRKMSSSSPAKQQQADRVLEIMHKKMPDGEFNAQAGNPDMGRYHEALGQLLRQEPKTVWHDVCGLWQDKGKVLYSCNATPKEITIPAGVKLLVLHNTNKNQKAHPDAQLKYITYDYQGGGEN